LLYTNENPEKSAVVEWIVLGFHVPVLPFGNCVVRRPMQLFEGRWTVTTRVPLVTCFTFEFFVMHLLA